MSIGPMPVVAQSAAGAPLAQTQGSEVERAQQDAGAVQRRILSERKAEAAAGIGEANGEEHETEERDADGRRAWELPAQESRSEAESARQPQCPDPSGQSGNLLDLSG